MSKFPVLSPELIRRLDVPGPRYTSYPTVPAWSDEFGQGDHVRALEAASHVQDSPLSIYVHIPFCRERCTFCGCNVIVAKDPRKADRYLDFLTKELGLVAKSLGARRGVSRLHLGGGTPTFLDENQLTRLWRSLTAEFTMLPDAEIAVEIDPVVTRDEQLELLRSFGFNRLSLGVQDLDPEVQKAVDRFQSVEETRGRIDLARRLGFRSVNMDLIYGLPRQVQDGWRRTIAQVVELRPERISMFSFAYVPKAKPHQRQLPLADLPTGPTKLELFRTAHDMLMDAGYLAIGMDHFAVPEDELSLAVTESRLWRDFQGYTIVRASDTVALGVTGISCVGGAYAQGVKTLPRYEAAISEGKLPTARGHWLSPDDHRRKTVITQLMCNGKVDLGADGESTFAKELAALSRLEADGLVEIHGSLIRATPIGRVFVRNIAMVFDAYLERQAEGATTFSRTV